MSWYDNGMPVINDPDVLCTAELIKRLYTMPEGYNGGPLHVIVEDGNTEDSHVLDSDYFGLREGHTIETYLCKSRWVDRIGYVFDDELYCSEEMADLCRLILASFRRMPEPWRAAAIAWADGTIAENLPILVDNPQAACEASPEQVDNLIAELRLWIEQDGKPGPKTCTPVPCPQFEPVDLKTIPYAPALQGVNLIERVERVRYEQSISHPGIRVTRLDEQGNPIGEPQLVGGWADVDIKIGEPDPDDPRPTLRWAEQTIRFTEGQVDPELWRMLYGYDLPQTDLEQVLAEPPKITLPEGWAELVEQALPGGTNQAAMPLFVELPEGTDVDAMTSAIELCRRAGLLDTPNGFVLFPPGTGRP